VQCAIIYELLIDISAIFRTRKKPHKSIRIEFTRLQYPPSLKLRRAQVEVRGIEPLSKHIPRKLSTCLYRHWLSGENRNRSHQFPP